MRTGVRSVAVLLPALAVAACQDQMTAPGGGVPQTAISDAAHGADGNPGFHWLAPMVPQPAASTLGTFASGLRPSIRLICLSTTDPQIECDPDVAIAEFAVGTGLVVHEGDHYHVDVHTDAYALELSSDASRTVYRILALTDPLLELGGPFVLGFADISLASTGREARNLATNELIGLVDGRTLPVKFRIDRGAYEHELKTAQATVPGDAPVPLCQQNCTVEVVESDAQSEVSLTDPASGEEVTGVLFEPGDVGTTSIVVIDELDTEGLDENCANGVMIDKRFCYRYKIFPDAAFNEPVRFGICPRDLPIGPGSYWRLFKVDYDADQRPIVTRPEMVDVSDFLPCSPASGTLGALRRAARYALEWVVAPLHAAFAEKVWGGMAGDFSDMFWAEDAEMTPVGSTDTNTAPGTTLTPTVLIQASNVGEPTVPVTGAEVTFEITDGTGWLTAPSGVTPVVSETTPDGRTFRMTLPTDEAGESTVQWTVGGGANALEASSSDAFTANHQPILFTATAIQPQLTGLVVDVNNYQVQLTPDHVGAAYFRGANVFFAGGVAYGTDESHMFFYNTRGGRESFVEAGISPFTATGGAADHHTAALTAESASPSEGPRSRLDLVTLRETFAWNSAPDADYVIVRYTLVNGGPQADNLRLGYFADADVAPNANANVAEYDALLQAALTYTPDQSLRSAVVVLGSPVAHYRHWVNPSASQPEDFIDPGSLSGWFGILASTANDAGLLGPTDVRNALTVAAETLPDDGTATLAVALIGGEDDADLAANIAAARARYATLAAAPAVHIIGIEISAETEGYSAVLSFPVGAAAFVATDARCGHAPVTVTAADGATLIVSFTEPTAGAEGRMYCSGRLADGSYFTGWDTAAGLDQQQPTLDTSVGNLAIGGSSEQMLAQVVTAGVSGNLVGVRVPVVCGGGNLVVEIQGVTEAQPNGAVLASQAVPAADLTSSFPELASFPMIAFSTPAMLNAGQQFAIVLKNTTPGASCSMIRGPVGNPYAGGDSFFDARPNQAGVWVLLGDRADLAFQTFME